MKLALKQCVYLDQAHVIGAWHIEGAIEIMLSIKVLLNSFANAFCDLTWHPLRPWNTGLSYVPPSRLLLERHMLNTG